MAEGHRDEQGIGDDLTLEHPAQQGAVGALHPPERAALLFVGHRRREHGARLHRGDEALEGGDPGLPRRTADPLHPLPQALAVGDRELLRQLHRLARADGAERQRCSVRRLRLCRPHDRPMFRRFRAGTGAGVTQHTAGPRGHGAGNGRVRGERHHLRHIGTSGPLR